MVYRLSTAALERCADARVRLRAPLSLLFNDNASEEMRTAIYRVSGVTDLPVIQAHTAAPNEGGARITAINDQAASNWNRAFNALNDAVRSNKPVELTPEEGRVLKELPVAACPTTGFTGYSAHLKGAFNPLDGIELTRPDRRRPVSDRATARRWGGRAAGRRSAEYP